MARGGDGQARRGAASGPGRVAGGAAAFDPRAILTSIGEVVYDWDIVSDGLSWGANAADVLGLADLGAVNTGRGLALLVEPDSGLTRDEAVHGGEARDRGDGVAYRTRYALRLSPDRVVTVEDAGRWFADRDGQPAFAHGVLRIESPADDAASLATRDRTSFLTLIAPDVADAVRAKRALTLVVASVDGLRHLNEELGEEAADAVLRTVATRVRSVMRRRDRLVRYAGNRLGLLLRSCAPDQIETAVKRIAWAVEGESIPVPGGVRGVRLRIGAACAPEHAPDAGGLLRRAEEALHAAKADVTKPFAVFSAAMARNLKRARDITTEIVEALNGRRVLIARQPIVDARTRQPAFGEALLRARAADGGLIAASEILPAIERAGLVPLVDTRVLELVADHLAADPDARMSLNLSTLTLERADWLGILASHLGARPGIASRLVVEITETAAVRDPAATRARLNAMKALGVGIALDDFGAGHTSFKHLRSFPVDLLKIDGAFVQNLARSPDDRFFVRTLVDLAQHLGIATVAEWVEDEETAGLLADWGVDYLQGTLCGAPALLETAPGAGMPKAAVA